MPYQSGRSPQPAIPRSVATRNLLLRKKIGSRHLSCSKLWSAVRMRDLRLSLRIRHKLSPKGMHKVAVGNAHGPCPRARADPERVAHRACTATHATLSGLGWERYIYLVVGRCPTLRSAAFSGPHHAPVRYACFLPLHLHMRETAGKCDHGEQTFFSSCSPESSRKLLILREAT